MEIKQRVIQERDSDHRKHPLTFFLIAANVIVFILVFSLPEESMQWVFNSLSFSSPTLFEFWRWFTSLFLHVSASHLFFNMLGLYFFGKVVEEETDKQWFLSIYFLSGFLGTFAFMLTSISPVVGASGCVFGIMGAAMLMNPTKRIHLYIFPLPLGVVAISFVIIETLIVYFQPEALVGVAENVANVAHLGGALTGGIFAFFYDPKRSMKGILVLGICLILLVLLAPVFGIIALVAGFALNIIDAVIGFILYGISNLISPIWG
jgi:membrane associated rhomboid family serine protease